MSPCGITSAFKLTMTGIRLAISSSYLYLQHCDSQQWLGVIKATQLHFYLTAHFYCYLTHPSLFPFYFHLY